MAQGKPPLTVRSLIESIESNLSGSLDNPVSINPWGHGVIMSTVPLGHMLRQGVPYASASFEFRDGAIPLGNYEDHRTRPPTPRYSDVMIRELQHPQDILRMVRAEMRLTSPDDFPYDVDALFTELGKLDEDTAIDLEHRTGIDRRIWLLLDRTDHD